MNLADSSHEDTIQSISWKHSGEVLASTGKDKKLRLWDPRDSSNNKVINSVNFLFLLYLINFNTSEK